MRETTWEIFSSSQSIQQRSQLQSSPNAAQTDCVFVFLFSCRENKMLSCKCLNFIASQQQQQQSGAPPAFSLHAFRQAFLQKYPRNFIFYSQCMDFFKQVHSIFFLFDVQWISLYVCVLMHFIWVSGWYIYLLHFVFQLYFVPMYYLRLNCSLVAPLIDLNEHYNNKDVAQITNIYFFWRRGLVFEISALKYLGNRLRKLLILYYFSLFIGENFELFWTTVKPFRSNPAYYNLYWIFF